MCATTWLLTIVTLYICLAWRDREHGSPPSAESGSLDLLLSCGTKISTWLCARITEEPARADSGDRAEKPPRQPQPSPCMSLFISLHLARQNLHKLGSIRTSLFSTFERASASTAIIMSKRKRTIPKVDAPATVAVDPAVVASSLLEETRTLRRSSRIKKTERLALIEVSLDDPEKEDSPLTVSGEDDELQVKSLKESPSKRKRRKKDVEPIVYDIPPVERKYTNFKGVRPASCLHHSANEVCTGRLGYACLNTVLRAQKPEPTFCSRTCRMDTIHKNGLDFAKNLGLQNCRDLYKLVEVSFDP